jgi:hypothetical protein
MQDEVLPQHNIYKSYKDSDEHQFQGRVQLNNVSITI